MKRTAPIKDMKGKTPANVATIDIASCENAGKKSIHMCSPPRIATNSTLISNATKILCQELVESAL